MERLLPLEVAIKRYVFGICSGLKRVPRHSTAPRVSSIRLPSRPTGSALRQVESTAPSAYGISELRKRRQCVLTDMRAISCPLCFLPTACDLLPAALMALFASGISGLQRPITFAL